MANPDKSIVTDGGLEDLAGDGVMCPEPGQSDLDPETPDQELQAVPAEESGRAEPDGEVYSDEEEELVIKRLKDLGYL